MVTRREFIVASVALAAGCRSSRPAPDAQTPANLTTVTLAITGMT